MCSECAQTPELNSSRSHLLLALVEHSRWKVFSGSRSCSFACRCKAQQRQRHFVHQRYSPCCIVTYYFMLQSRPAACCCVCHHHAIWTSSCHCWQRLLFAALFAAFPTAEALTCQTPYTGNQRCMRLRLLQVLHTTPQQQQQQQRVQWAR